jgi:putative ATP-dependent endonuclease of OLD family
MGTSRKSKVVEPMAQTEAIHEQISVARPRLHKLRVSNFRCIGQEHVEIELDDIVVLVGPNNTGKSSILRAYEVVMNHGSSDGCLSLEDFPNGKIDENCLPTIELETVVFDKNAPGETWVRTDEKTQEMFVREKWTWREPGLPIKVGWDVAVGDWHASAGPWGAANVGNSNRPKPHRVTAFLDPGKQAGEVVALLKEAINARVKNASNKKKTFDEGSTEPTDYEKLLHSIKELQKAIASEATTAIEDVRKSIGDMVAEVFPGYGVTLDARPEDDVEKTVSLFKAAPVLKMGPTGGHQATLDRQGSGACRTLLWAALRILAERPADTIKPIPKNERPHLLLIDEPELCLHPDAIREACRVLYNLPSTKNWQVMLTTHSPVFIDLSRDNTSIARVERTTSGAVHGTTVYRPKRARLDDNDKAELKMLNMFDPYIAEFFFGGRTIIVEGDTEHSVFKWIIAQESAKYKGIHVIRARGKSCITPLCKILNQFGKNYAVLHDADRETIYDKKGALRANPAWAENGKVFDATKEGRKEGRIRLLASVPNFEEAFWNELAECDKPYAALARIKRDDSVFRAVVALLDALLDSKNPVPANVKEWSSLDTLATDVAAFDGRPKPQLQLFAE